MPQIVNSMEKLLCSTSSSESCCEELIDVLTFLRSGYKDNNVLVSASLSNKLPWGFTVYKL